MKPQISPTSTTKSPYKQQDPIQNDLLSTIGFHVNQSSRIIFNIKQSLYQLVKLNVNASAPTKKYQTNAAIVGGSKRNLDDLRRIQSMLKGYMNTIKLDTSGNSQEDSRNVVEDNGNAGYNGSRNTGNGGEEIVMLSKNVPVLIIEQNRSLTSSNIQGRNQLLSNSNGNSNITNTNIKINDTNTTTNRISENPSSNITDKQQQNSSLITQLKTLRQQNSKLRRQIQQSRSKLTIGLEFKQEEIYNMKNNKGNQKRMSMGVGENNMPVMNALTMRQRQNQKIRHKNQNLTGRNLSRQQRQLLNLEQQYFKTQPNQNQNQDNNNNDNDNQPNKQRKLQHCKSAILQASHNLQQVRNRNKAALNLIRIIKKQIGVRYPNQAQIQCI